MSEIKSSWRKQSAWHCVGTQKSFGAKNLEPGVIVELCHDAEMLGLLAPHGSSESVSAAMQDRYAVKLPLAPGAERCASFDLIWSAPDQWLAFTRTSGGLDELERTAKDFVAVVGQSGARAVLRVSGASWRLALAKGCPLDLHAESFPQGFAAATVISLVGANMWRLDDEDSVYISVFRSMAESFWDWLKSSSEEFGLCVVSNT